MRILVRNIMALLLLLFVGSTQALFAQFNPVNPPEPEENLYYNVSVTSSNETAAYTSGSGKYKEGTKITVRYSLRNSNYSFSHWSINGEKISVTSSSFTHTVAADDNIVAHFKYTPVSPQEPSSKNEHKLFFESDNYRACSFNQTSGMWVESGKYVALSVTVNQGYRFLGWYRNDVLVSSSATFSYLMPDEEVTLIAKFEYNPFNPSDPESDGSQDDVQTTLNGDVNGDGTVSVTDIQSVVNLILSAASAEDNPAADVNGDGTISVTDIQSVVNIILNIR